MIFIFDTNPSKIEKKNAKTHDDYSAFFRLSTSLLQEPIDSSGQDISPALDPSNSPVSRRKSAQMADPKKIQGSGANCSRSLSPSVTGKTGLATN